MTPKQKERLQKKIVDIKRTLASEKRKFGFYDDSSGIRYLPTKYFIRIADYRGGLVYTKWFDKNFPGDSGFPEFLFEWTLILFKNGKTIESEKKAIQTFFSNTYIFDKFLDKKFLTFDKYEGSDWERVSMTNQFGYSLTQSELMDFADWLTQFLTSDRFYRIANKFIEIEHRLKTEPVGSTRTRLVSKRYSLLEEYK